MQSQGINVNSKHLRVKRHHDCTLVYLNHTLSNWLISNLFVGIINYTFQHEISDRFSMVSSDVNIRAKWVQQNSHLASVDFGHWNFCQFSWTLEGWSMLLSLHVLFRYECLFERKNILTQAL